MAYTSVSTARTVKAVLFDVFGTVVDWRTGVAAAVGRFVVRAWIAIVLVGYAALFLAIILGMTFAGRLRISRDAGLHWRSSAPPPGGLPAFTGSLGTNRVPVLLAAVAISLIVGVLAGLYPALRAARLAPAESLRLI